MTNVDLKRVSTILSETIKVLAESKGKIVKSNEVEKMPVGTIVTPWVNGKAESEFLMVVDDGMIPITMLPDSDVSVPNGEPIKGWGYSEWIVVKNGIGKILRHKTASQVSLDWWKNGRLAEAKSGPLSDEQVIDLFTDKAAGASKKLISNGTRLDGLWMGGNDIAHWEKGKIVFTDLGSKAADKYQRMVRKIAPKSYLA